LQKRAKHTLLHVIVHKFFVFSFVFLVYYTLLHLGYYTLFHGFLQTTLQQIAHDKSYRVHRDLYSVSGCECLYSIKAGTHEGACSWNMLPQHAPGAKFPRVYQRFHSKKVVAQQNFCSRVLLHWIKLVKYEGASFRSKSVAGACFRSKLSRVCRPLYFIYNQGCYILNSNYILYRSYFIPIYLPTHFYYNSFKVLLWYYIF